MKPHTMSVSPQPVPAGHTALDLLRAAAKKNTHFRQRLKRVGLLLAHGRPIKLSGHPERVQALETALRGFAGRHPQRVPITTNQLLQLPIGEAPVRVTLHRPDGWPVSEYRIARVDEFNIQVQCIDGVTRTLHTGTFRQLFAPSLFTLRVAPLPAEQVQAA